MCGQPTGLHTCRPHRGGATPTVSAQERSCSGEPHPLSKRALTRGLLVDLGWASILPVPPVQPGVYTNSSPLGLSSHTSPGPLSWSFCRNLSFSTQPPCIPAGARLRLWTAANRNGQGPRGSSVGLPQAGCHTLLWACEVPSCPGWSPSCWRGFPEWGSLSSFLAPSQGCRPHAESILFFPSFVPGHLVIFLAGLLLLYYKLILL